MIKNTSTFLTALLLISLLISSCRDTEGCTDPLANNTGDYDTNCCCTYDSEQFHSEYLGDLRFENFGALLDADSVNFLISPAFSPDSVNIQITTPDAIIPAGARVAGDSLYISAFAPEFEIAMMTSAVQIDGGALLVGDSLFANLTLDAIDLNLQDDFEFIGAKID